MKKMSKWYNRWEFPLIPLLDIRKPDRHDTGNFSLKWLFFTIWTLDSFAFEVSFVIDTHWGIGFVGIFPYMRWVATIPCPEPVGCWIDKWTSRKPKIDDEYDT